MKTEHWRLATGVWRFGQNPLARAVHVLWRAAFRRFNPEKGLLFGESSVQFNGRASFSPKFKYRLGKA
jgi:hypothetical protein